MYMSTEFKGQRTLLQEKAMAPPVSPLGTTPPPTVMKHPVHQSTVVRQGRCVRRLHRSD